MLHLNCPICNHRVACPPGSAGQMVTCGNCETAVRVPADPPPSLRDDGNPLARAPAGGPFPEDLFEPPANLPPEADRLGPPTQQFRSKYGVGTAVFGVVLTVLGLAASVVVFVLIVDSFRSPSPGSRVPSTIAMFTILFAAIVMVIAGVWKLVQGLSGMKTQVLLCDGGLIDCRPRRIEVCPWDDVDHFWRQVTDTRVYVNGAYRETIRRHLFRVQMKDGRRFNWNDDYRGVGALGPRIEQEVNLRRLPSALADLNAGRAVPFDAVVVTPHGLELSQGRVAWDQISAIELIQGYVYIRDHHRADPWAKISVHQIANVFVFLSVVQTLSGKVRT
jgi:hypothetical protein